MLMNQESSPSTGAPARRRYVAAILVAVVAAACARAANDAAKAPSASDTANAHGSHGMAGDVVIPPGVAYTAADVHFMQGMIAHHGQAILMASMAKSHGAGPQLLTFTLKIDLSQRAEIDRMQWWLKDRKQAVPDSSAHQHMMMAGMLTAEQLKQLDAAKGKAFDKLFLELMIQHHEGAITMVDELFAANGGAEPDVYSLANDIKTDQTAEIQKMREMLGNP
jgi:uncharacterized protein (DUF305 family)